MAASFCFIGQSKVKTYGNFDKMVTVLEQVKEVMVAKELDKALKQL